MAKTPVSTKLTAKQVDRLMKLIALANNNNAEGEANSAARQACKMLDGYIFMATDFSTPNPPPPSKPTSYGNPYQQDVNYNNSWFDEEFFKEAFKGGFKTKNPNYSQPKPPKDAPPGKGPPGSNRGAKKGETETHSKPHQDYRSSKQGTDPYDDFKKAYAETKQQTTTGPTTHSGPNQEYNPTGSQRDFWRNFTTMSDEEFLKFQRAKREETNPNKKVLKCTKCRLDIETGYVGHPGGFVCFTCQMKRV